MPVASSAAPVQNFADVREAATYATEAEMALLLAAISARSRSFAGKWLGTAAATLNHRHPQDSTDLELSEAHARALRHQRRRL